MQLLQSPRAQADARTSFLLLRFPFLCLSIGSNMFSPAVSVAMDVTTVTISIAISVGGSLLPSASPLPPSDFGHHFCEVRLFQVIPHRRLLVCRHVGSVMFFAKTSREAAQLRGFLRAPSFSGLAGSGKLAQGSIRLPESITVVLFSLAVVVVDLTRCFCFANSFVDPYRAFVSARAKELFVHVMETSRRVLGHEHLQTLTSMANLASTYGNQERWKEAEQLFVQVIDMRKQCFHQSSNGPVQTGTVQSSPGPVQEIFGPGSDQSPIYRDLD